MQKALLALLAVGLLVVCMNNIAGATLHDRGDGLIYDDDLDITWLKDANYALTSNYDNDGLMTWQEAVAFVDFLNNINHLGYADWRLPSTMQPDPSCQSQGDYLGNDGIIDTSWGDNCLGSEMGHLYYTELGNIAGGPFTNTGPFSNLVAYNGYWSGTASILEVGYYWHFVFAYGGSHMISNYAQLNVIPVRDGDVLPPDSDGDGYNSDIDCDDNDASIYPGAYELPGDVVDDNCDGSLGECDPNGCWKNHGQFVRCVAHETDALVELGILTQDEGDILISTAASSGVGKDKCTQ